MIGYHGTPTAEAILTEGVRMDIERRADPGDFGWGFYLTLDLSRASNFGDVLQVVVDDSELARIDNPYFLHRLETVEPVTPEEKLFFGIVFGPDREMMNVRGPWDQRVRVSKQVREAFLEAGWKGIYSESQRELVVFDPAVVRSVRPHLTYRYETCCVESMAELIDALTDDDVAVELDHDEFAAAVEGLDEWAVSKGYDLDPEEGLTLAQDWHVSYYQSVYDGRPCFFLQWSGIEFIWTEAGHGESFGYGSQAAWD